MVTVAPGRQEDFTIDAFRHLEGRLHDFRKTAMKLAAAVAEREMPESESYQVTRAHVDSAVAEIFHNWKKYSLDLGLEANG